MNLIDRTQAAQAAIDAFLFTPFAWGSADCAALAIACLKAAGHTDPLSGVTGYTTALGAKRTLTRLGHDRLEDALDAMGLTRVAPASTLTGDIVAMPGDDLWPALGVNVGEGRVLAFLDAEAGPRGDYISLEAAHTAWRLA